MKKVFLTLALMVTTMVASAQFYVGGGIGYSKTEVGDAETTVLSIEPEIGYVLNEDWAIGAVVGFENEKDVANTFAIEPYVRYTVLKAGAFSVFADGAVGFGMVKPEVGDDTTIWSVGVKPGVAYNVNEKISICAHIGWLGYADYDTVKETAIKLNNKLEFSFYYNFYNNT